MKVAIDNGPLKTGDAVRGIGTYTKELIDALRYESKTNNDLVIDAFDFNQNRKKIYSSKFDLYHYPTFHPYFVTLPPKLPAKTIVTVHDLIQLIYPQSYPAGVRGKFHYSTQKNRIRNADGIVTVSETSKKDIVRFLGIDQSRIKVIYLAPKKIFTKIGDRNLLNKVAGKYSLPSKFVLYVGDINYNKNIPVLLEAVKIANVPLVICGKQALDAGNEGINENSFSGPKDWLRYLMGKPHPELAHYKLLFEEFNKNNNIFRLGFVPDEDLVAIYNLATVYCQPSLYEGFGLPVLEAFACSLPVIVSRTQALIEVADKAALVFDPKDAKDLAAKLVQIFKDTSLSVKLTREGTDRVKNFSWSKTALQMIEFYKEIIGN